LQDHLLVHWLVPQETGARQVHKFRELLIQTIEQMRLGEDSALGSRAGRTYHLLALRYIEQQDTPTVLDQLALSERQYYREHPKAIRSLSALLRNDSRAVPEAPAEPEPPTLSAQTEVERLQSQGSPARRSDLDALIAEVLQSVQPLADQSRIALAEVPASHLSIAEVDAAILRSILLWIASDLMAQAQPGATLAITCHVQPRGYRFAFCMSGSADWAALRQNMAGRETLQYLVRTLNGLFAFSESADLAPCVHVDIPFKERTILVIDDNLDVADLLRRYLVDQPFHILTAVSGEQGIELARSAHPSVIILDVMMPGHDGLATLQALKHNPAVQAIPVWICSILDTPDLFYSLGAAGYLRKPPGREDFLTVLAQLPE
jgi:CheY-like chemotaxis protein